MTESTQCTLQFDDPKLANQLFGVQNANLELFASRASVHIATRGSIVSIQGPPQSCTFIQNLLSQLYSLLKSGLTLHAQDLQYAFDLLDRDPATDLKQVFHDTVFIASPKKKIAPKTVGQREYVRALRTKDMTIAVGPAGTGKTYLAVAVALFMLTTKRVKRIILTRPAVEAGERLGFLPGDMAQKVNPYLRPLYDALHDMLDYEKVAEMVDTGIIEIAPLAFMRGRTLNDAFIILDEAQNTTPEQMKMFVTRLGFGSRMAITGDITQIDLPGIPGKVKSGLVEALTVLNRVEGIAVHHFYQEDVIRHPLVGRIINAYDTQTNT